MEKISDHAINQLFTEARTFTDWQAKPVEDEILHQLYELMKWAPTSANANPARIVFTKSAEEKNKLLSVVAPGNVEKVKAAPVTAVIAFDENFYEELPRLFPHVPDFKNMFINTPSLAQETAFRNSSLQGAYFILAARALGLDCGPMSGFNNQQLDELFFSKTSWKSNFICNLGYGDSNSLHPRGPRLTFDEACKII